MHIFLLFFTFVALQLIMSGNPAVKVDNIPPLRKTELLKVGEKVLQIFLLLKLLVDGQVKFGQVITSITERLSTQYAADHNSQPADNKYGWIFGIRYVPPGMDGSNRDFHEQIWIHPEMTHGEFKSKYKVVRQG